MFLSISALAVAQNVQKAPTTSSETTTPDLDLLIRHYSHVQTSEGVIRESRFEEKMVRRPGNVWISRVLPKTATAHREGHAHENNASDAHLAKPSSGEKSEAHKHFNHVTMTRHVIRDGEKIRLEMINTHNREVVAIAPAEYENVDFDGSWVNAFFLIDPKRIADLPMSGRVSKFAHARWRQQEKNGLIQQVLWDDKKMIPLVVETGDREGHFFERIEVKPQTSASSVHPWLDTKGFVQKDYTDFLD